MIPLLSSNLSRPVDDSPEEISLRAFHFPLTRALRIAVVEKAARLLRRDRRLGHIHIDLEQDHAHPITPRLIAKGRIGSNGAALVASAESDNALTSLNLLIDRLDRMLSERAPAA